MEPLTGMLMGGTILGGLFDNAEKKRQAAENLAFQKWLANEELKLAKSSRTDAYGNTVRYDDALDKWLTDLTPQQQALMRAGEREQLQGLTTDAARNRVIRERAYNRGMDASEDYNRARADYQYGYNPSEGAINDQLTSLIMRGRGAGGGSAGDTRKFIRQRGNLPVVSSGGGGNSGVSSVANALLQARSGALGERGTRQQQRNMRLPELQSLAAMSDSGSGGGAPFPNFDKLFGAEGDMSKGALGAMEAGGKGVGSAYKDAIGIKSPFDLGNTAKMIAALRGSPTGKVSPIASSTSIDNRDLDSIMYDF